MGVLGRIGDPYRNLGPSGCGKSTLLRCINYLEVPTSGRVWLRGELLGQLEVGGKLVPQPERLLNQKRARIGMVFQRFHLFANMTVLENIIAAPMLVKRWSRAQAENLALQLLTRMGLQDKKAAFPRQLSGGQEQRTAIARALAMQPELLLLDEPTSALDPELVLDVLRAIRELARDGMTMVMVTHEVDFARETAHRVVFLDRGVILEQGPPAELLGDQAPGRILEFLGKIRRAPPR